jgi:hypothetical protein
MGEGEEEDSKQQLSPPNEKDADFDSTPANKSSTKSSNV